ncbi:MAG: GGDEF domain-containing protein [Piscirickettsiaceae bacterium]|nr:MAG: GGDEF domain-containing protein [Piscirickettsiaceae bacterium]
MFDSSADGWSVAALNSAAFGVLVLDEKRVVWINRFLEKTLNKKANDLIGCLLSPDDNASTILLGSEQTFQVSQKKSDDIWLRREHVQTGESDVYFFHDCTDLVIIGNECRRLQVDLNDMNPNDPITGMMNLDVITQLLDGHISRSRRYSNPLSLMRITYAFPPNMDPSLFERSIKRIAFFLKDQLRWADQIGMLDKHTFLVILPETGYSSASTLLNKFQGDAHLALFSKGDGRPLSFSVGLAEWNKGDTTSKMLQNIRQDVDLAMLT